MFECTTVAPWWFQHKFSPVRKKADGVKLLQAFLEKEDLWSKSSVTIIDEKSKFHTDFRNKIESKQNLEHTLFKGKKKPNLKILVQEWDYCIARKHLLAFSS